jgi:hypothetical protein
MLVVKKKVEHWRNDKWQGEIGAFRNYLLCATLYTTNLIRTILETDPDLRGERPAANVKVGLNLTLNNRS